MPEPLSRRRFLEAAGGTTFLALVATGSGGRFAYAAAAAPNSGRTAFPLFSALPYIQPGASGGGPVRDNSESLTLAWQTNAVPAEFVVTCERRRGDKNDARLTPVRTERHTGGDDGESLYNYATVIGGLTAGTRYEYSVEMNGKPLAEGFFTTRQPRGQKVRFAAFGDNSFGDISDRMIAYQAHLAHPDFVMNTGDNVYENGLENEYARYFFPVYNADTLSPRTGSPLLRSVPFYTVIANHDVHDKDANGHPLADLDKNPDSLAYYTAMHLPLNGPAAPTFPTPTSGGTANGALASLQTAAGERFPRMANYSFDYGDAHFLCLDSNVYIDPTDPALQAWIAADLTAAAGAPWKFVVFHHPSFNVGDEHYSEQHMRVLSPLFEKNGVDIVLHGHEHTYQRTVPFTFAPSDVSAAKNVGSKKRLVPGTFTLDREFDGITKTTPRGIVYVTTGAGGKHLYNPEMNATPSRWRHAEDGNVEYLARFVSDRHSLTVFDMDAHTLDMRQIDQWGTEIDRVRFTKPKG